MQQRVLGTFLETAEIIQTLSGSSPETRIEGATFSVTNPAEEISQSLLGIVQYKSQKNLTVIEQCPLR